MLITLAITILLVRAVLLTKDIAVCVPLDSKVQGVRKVTPVVSNRSKARVHYSFIHNFDMHL